MKSAKPAFEKINPAFGTSVHIKQYADPLRNKLPFWHVHPEMELVYIKGGSGKRHIGNQISYFNNGDLIFVGANIPHFGFTDGSTGNRSETIVQMMPNFLGDEFFNIPEMGPIKKLFDRARLGIAFHGNTKKKVGSKIEKLVKYDNYDRLLKLLAILKELAITTEYTILNAEGYAMEIEAQDNERMNHVYEYVRSNFQRSIALEEIADRVSMTVPAFCRYFKKISGKTFTKFVNDYRLVHASKLLADKPTSITDICFESGFNNFSHFNKLFKEFTGKSPSTYRTEFKKIVS